MENAQNAAFAFDEFLKSRKIGTNGNKLTHKSKRVGTVDRTGENGINLLIFTQFDGFFFELLDKQSDYIKSIVTPQISDNNCPRCKPGKCSVTCIRITLRLDEETEFAEKLLVLRCEAIDCDRVPKCNYIKAADRDKKVPCHKCKVCNPACRALRNF